MRNRPVLIVTLAAGAALGTLPDLDSLPMWFMGLDPVTNMTWHRGPSHSLLVLLPLAALLWWLFKRTGGRVAEAPTRWFWRPRRRARGRPSRRWSVGPVPSSA